MLSAWPRKLKRTEPATTLSGGRMTPAMVLIRLVLPQLELAGQAIDLVLPDAKGDVVDRTDLALDAEITGLVVGAQTA